MSDQNDEERARDKRWAWAAGVVFFALPVLIVLTALWFLLRTPFQADDGDATLEMGALWDDNYVHLPDGMPPWPRGFNYEQLNVLETAESVHAAIVNPYRSDPAGVQFHGHRVLGARAYRERDDVTQIVEQIIGNTRDIPTRADEFYPVYALRITSRTGVVDLTIGDFRVGMYVMTPTEQRFCVVDPQIGHLLRELTRGLPRKYEHDGQIHTIPGHR